MAEAAPRRDSGIPKEEANALRRAHAPFDDTFAPDYRFEKARKREGAPSATRREAMKLFKERMAAQERAWATVRTSIERTLEQNPDTPSEELEKIIDSYSAPYGFSRLQRTQAKNLIREYHETRAKVLQLRKETPNDRELIAKVTGVMPLENDNVEVGVGLMQFEFTVDPNLARLIRKDGDPIQDPVAPKPLPYAAFASGPRFGGVVPYNVYVRPADANASIHAHEFQHQKYSHYMGTFERKLDQGKLNSLWQEYLREHDHERRTLLLTRYLEEGRELGLTQVKDEVFAYSRDGVQNMGALHERFKAGDPSYDYLKPIREAKSGDALYQSVVQKILVDDYARIIHESIRSYEEVARVVGVPDAIALFTNKSFRNWPKAAARMLTAEQKKGLFGKEKKPFLPKDVLAGPEERARKEGSMIAELRRRLGI